MNSPIRFFLVLLIVFIVNAIYSQNETSIYTDRVIIPKTVSTSVSDPVEGTIIYDTTANDFVFFDGANWNLIGGVFQRQGTTIRLSELTDMDDFIFGKEGLPTNDQSTDKYFFFDQSKGAFRGGEALDSLWNSINIGSNSFAYGKNSNAKGSNSVAFGFQSRSNATGAIAMGALSLAEGSNSIAIGLNSIASNFGSVALGRENRATGVDAIAIGRSARASGDSGSIALGRFTCAIGNNGSTALGWFTEASGDNGSTALGDSTRASGAYGSTALGYNTQALGRYGSTAMGYFSKAEGANGSIALGDYALATGDKGSIALGYNTVASGDWGSTALGNSTRAEGIGGSTALGYRTTARGIFGSTALGMYTSATGSYGATALGWYAQASGDGVMAMGMFNDPIVSAGTDTANTNPILILGNGNSPQDRSNAMVVLKNGNTGFGLNDPTSHIEQIFDSTPENAHIKLIEKGDDGARIILENDQYENSWTVYGRPFSNAAASRMNFYYDDVSGSGSATGNKFQLFGDGDATLAGTLTQNSDVRLKSNILPITDALSKIKQINGYTYNWKSDKTNLKKQVGVIAQEVRMIIPEIVKENEEGMLSVSYTSLVPVLIEGMKEQQEIISGLVSKVEQLEEIIKERKSEN